MRVTRSKAIEKRATFLKFLFEITDVPEGTKLSLVDLCKEFQIATSIISVLLSENIIKKLPGSRSMYVWNVGEPNIRMATVIFDKEVHYKSVLKRVRPGFISEETTQVPEPAEEEIAADPTQRNLNELESLRLRVVKLEEQLALFMSHPKHKSHITQSFIKLKGLMFKKNPGENHKPEIKASS